MNSRAGSSSPGVDRARGRCQTEQANSAAIAATARSRRPSTLTSKSAGEADDDRLDLDFDGALVARRALRTGDATLVDDDVHASARAAGRDLIEERAASLGQPRP